MTPHKVSFFIVHFPFLFNFFGTGYDLFFPFIVLGIQLIGFKSVFTSVGTDNGFVVYVKRYPVAAGYFLRKAGAAVFLDFFFVPHGVYYPVEFYTVAEEQGFNVKFGTVGRSVCPDFISEGLQLVYKRRRTEPQSFLEEQSERKDQFPLTFVCGGIYKQDFVQVK